MNKTNKQDEAILRLEKIRKEVQWVSNLMNQELGKHEKKQEVINIYLRRLNNLFKMTEMSKMEFLMPMPLLQVLQDEIHNLIISGQEALVSKLDE